jgi:hypothetical protein
MSNKIVSLLAEEKGYYADFSQQEMIISKQFISLSAQTPKNS